MGKLYINEVPAKNLKRAISFKERLLALFVLLLFSIHIHSEPTIIADPSAALSEQPDITRSHNGITQINIQTPTNGGVSVNQYKRFDVTSDGAILNNGHNNHRSHLGGYIEGNPNLTSSEARVILNQINSINPSELNGYIEVSGQKADVIIANPEGINLNGGGFINAGGVTLTTGKAIMSHGNLEGFIVQQGQINIKGKGLDSTASDYTQILTTAARIHGELKGRELKIVTGHQELTPTGIPTAKLTSGEIPAISIDTAHLGGMYANKITLISTDRGAGVNNRGQIISHTSLKLDVTGELSNRGTLESRGDLQIETETLEHKGQLQSSGDLQLQIKSDFTPKSDISSGNNLELHTAGELNNRHNLQAAGQLKINALSINNSGLLRAGKKSLLHAEQSLTNKGQIYAEHISIDTPEITNGSNTSETETGTIAALTRLDLGTEQLNNLGMGADVKQGNHSLEVSSLIYSGGELHIGRTLNTEHHAQGRADIILNRGARIESELNLHLNAEIINNLNNNWQIQRKVQIGDGEYIHRYNQPGSPYWYYEGKDGHWHQTSNHAQGQFSFYDNRSPIKQSDWNEQSYTKYNYEDKLLHSEAGQILSGTDLYLSCKRLLNENSRLQIGGHLQGRASEGLTNKSSFAGSYERMIGQAWVSYARKKHFKWRRKEKDRYSFDRTIQTGQQPYVNLVDPLQTSNPKITSLNPIKISHTQGLYQMASSDKGYLIELDPRYTNYRRWLGSDYMLARLNNSPEHQQKRLGDNAYERQLINEQINQLTGHRRLKGYQSEQIQQQSLMDNAISFATKYHLSPGIHLSDELQSKLTTNIIWLEEQTYSLLDGQSQKVLVPKVYLQREGLTPRDNGGLISANNLNLESASELNNTGKLQSWQQLTLAGENIENRGTLLAQDIELKADKQLTISGGHLQAENSLNLHSKHLKITPLLSSYQSPEWGYSRPITRPQLSVTANAGQNLTLQGTRTLELRGAQLTNNSHQGKIHLKAGESLQLGTAITSGYNRHGQQNSQNYRQIQTIDEIGSHIQSNSDIQLETDGQLSLRQSEIESIQGNLYLTGNDIQIQEGRKTLNLEQSIEIKTDDILNNTQRNGYYSLKQNLGTGSTLLGQTILLTANNDIKIQSSTLIAEQDIKLTGGKDISLTTTANYQQQIEQHKIKKTGILSSGGLGLTLGSRQTATYTEQMAQTAGTLTAGSLTGDTLITAGSNYLQRAGQLKAIKGDLKIQAQNLQIEGEQEQRYSIQKQQLKQNGLTLSLTTPLTSIIKQTLNALESIERVGNSDNRRVNAMALAVAGWDSYRTANQLLSYPTGTSETSDSISLRLSYGKQQSDQENLSQRTDIAFANLQAGGDLHLIATEDDINLKGTDIAGEQSTKLNAANNIHIKAATEHSIQQSTNKSSGWNIGALLGLDKSISFGISLGGNRSKGQGYGQSSIYHNSHIGNLNGSTLISSSDTINLKGAQILGDRVTLNTTNLHIESLQDSETYNSKQKSISGQLTIGTGISGSASLSKSKINADHLSVYEQSGVLAGENGFSINIGQHSDLIGGIITSATTAEQNHRNNFTTGSISTTDLQNHSEYDASGFSLAGGVEINGGWDGETVDKQGNPTTTVSRAIGYGSDSDNQTGTTQSGIGTSNITITDTAKQATIQGDVLTNLDSIKTQTTSAEVLADQGLKNTFDKDAVMTELDIQVKVTKEFRQNAFSLVNEYTLPKQAELREQIKNAKTEEEKTQLYDEIYKLQYQKRFLETVVGIVAGTPDAAITQGTLQLAATKMREESLANSRQSPGVIIKDEEGNSKLLNNVSYDSGYFDGVKLGGVRLDLDVICGKDNLRCENNNGELIPDANGNYTFKGDRDYQTYQELSNDVEKSGSLYGMTGGFQPVKGGWYYGGKPLMEYESGSISDAIVESFAGTHDFLGGQIWGWYGNDGNTSRDRGAKESIGSSVTAGVAIPVAAPFAVSELISPDILQILLKMGEQ